MKIRLIPFCLVVAGALNLGLKSASADVRFSAGIEISAAADFYQPLTPYGAWVEVGSYGRCWHPSVAVGWRPYTSGHWEWTDVGWYWVSDEQWAWACYHYGSWAYDSGYGWVWVPGVEWAPAWVNWRYSDAYVGWSPCGPGGVVLAPSAFVFVDIGHFHDRIRPDRVIVNNTTIINQTTVVNNFRRETRTIEGRPQTVVVNEGPRTDVIQKATGKRLSPVPVTQVARQEPVPATVKRSAWRDRVIQESAGKEQPRTQQQPAQQSPAAKQPPVVNAEPKRALAPAPEPKVQEPPSRTGKEQPRTYQQPAQRAPSGEQAPTVTPDVKRKPAPAPEPRTAPLVPRTPPSQVVPPERPPGPPTGYERGYPPDEHIAPPPARGIPPERPAAREVPPRSPPAEKEKGKGHEKEKDQP